MDQTLRTSDNPCCFTCAKFGCIVHDDYKTTHNACFLRRVAVRPWWTCKLWVSQLEARKREIMQQDWQLTLNFND